MSSSDGSAVPMGGGATCLLGGSSGRQHCAYKQGVVPHAYADGFYAHGLSASPFPPSNAGMPPQLSYELEWARSSAAYPGMLPPSAGPAWGHGHARRGSSYAPNPWEAVGGTESVAASPSGQAYHSPLLGGSESDGEQTAHNTPVFTGRAWSSPSVHHQAEGAYVSSPSASSASSSLHFPPLHPAATPLASYLAYPTAPVPSVHHHHHHHHHQYSSPHCAAQQLGSPSEQDRATADVREATAAPSLGLARRRGRKRRCDDPIMVPHPSVLLVPIKSEEEEDVSGGTAKCANAKQDKSGVDSPCDATDGAHSLAATSRRIKTEPDSRRDDDDGDDGECFNGLEAEADDFFSDDSRDVSDGDNEPQSRTAKRSKSSRCSGHKRQVVKVERKVNKVLVTEGLNIEAHLSPESDGYRWRKYGRKTVKGSPYPRSYFKCTFPHCLVKKQVEAVIKDGHIISTCSIYKGKHNHERPCVTQLTANDQESFRSTVITEFSKHGRNGGISADTSANSTPRLVITTEVSVDYLDDGYRWRKYGQKYVKGSGYPRSYYKCTDKLCPVKKQVDSLVSGMIVTYEGAHTHEPCLDRSSSRKRRRRSSSTGLGSERRPSTDGQNEDDEENGDQEEPSLKIEPSSDEQSSGSHFVCPVLPGPQPFVVKEDSSRFREAEHSTYLPQSWGMASAWSVTLPGTGRDRSQDEVPSALHPWSCAPYREQQRQMLCALEDSHGECAESFAWGGHVAAQDCAPYPSGPLSTAPSFYHALEPQDSSMFAYAQGTASFYSV